jgi:signal transduction histidine kinase
MLSVGDRSWALVVHSTPRFEAAVGGLAVPAILIIGALISVMLSRYLALLIKGRQTAYALARSMTRELETSHDELTRAFDDLKAAQGRLVQAEKLASLGGLVAGVAHEINTPISNGLTGASTLANETATIMETLRRGELRKTEVRTYLEAAEELARLILSNMQRAATLVNSFKRLAADQTGAQRRRFNLHQCIEDVLFSFKSQLRLTGHGVDLAAPNDLDIDGYPGALSQVVTNFMTNALVHAFPGDRHGHIIIRATPEPAGMVTMTFSDDGAGVPRDHLGRIFDPFFTTRRGDGGTGLGLHLVHNLVTVTLGGYIQVVSDEGRGTTFTVIFPRTMPEHDRGIGAKPSDDALVDQGRAP